jgi:hypothetical protein
MALTTVPSSMIQQMSAANMPAGSVIQTVSVVTTATDFSTASTSFVAVTNSVASITPQFSNSKILVTLIAPRLNAYNDSQGLRITLYRVAPSTVAIGTTNGYPFFPYGSTSNQRSNTLSITVLDSPATTSTVTYQMYGRAEIGTVFLADGHPQTFILQEIKG